MQYPTEAITPLLEKIKQAPEGYLKSLAQRLIQGAQNYDNFRTQKVIDNPYYVQPSDKNPDGIKRNFNDPANYIAPHLIGQDFADEPNDPLSKHGEEWNKDRRAILDGTQYQIGDDGRPVNPYLKTGIRSLGVIGKFGPNHAVDAGLLREEDGVLKALGIKKGGNPTFCGGFAEYQKDENGKFIVDTNAWKRQQADEFFEEMVSGSITLTAEFNTKAEGAFADKISELERKRKNTENPEVPESERTIIWNQVLAQYKREQAEKLTPEFFDRLYEFFEKGDECYRGPVRSATRNTDNAWMETYLSYQTLTDRDWELIRGDTGYELSAGDDADDVAMHVIDEELLKGSTGTHSAMFIFMAASYLLDHAIDRQEIPESITTQLEKVATFLENIKTTPGIKYDHLVVG